MPNRQRNVNLFLLPWRDELRTSPDGFFDAEKHKHTPGLCPDLTLPPNRNLSYLLCALGSDRIYK